MASPHPWWPRGLLGGMVLALSLVVILPCWATPQQRRLQYQCRTCPNTRPETQMPGYDLVYPTQKDLLGLPQTSLTEASSPEPDTPPATSVEEAPPPYEVPLRHNVSSLEILGGIAVFLFLVIEGIRRQRRA